MYLCRRKNIVLKLAHILYVAMKLAYIPACRRYLKVHKRETFVGSDFKFVFFVFNMFKYQSFVRKKICLTEFDICLWKWVRKPPVEHLKEQNFGNYFDKV